MVPGVSVDHGLATGLAALPDTEIAEIAAYLKKAPTGDKLRAKSDIANGEKLFRQNCTYCHGFGSTRLSKSDIGNFLKAQNAIGPLLSSAPVWLTPAQFDASKQLYFNRCAGCHGLYRTGATGPKRRAALL